MFESAKPRWCRPSGSMQCEAINRHGFGRCSSLVCAKALPACLTPLFSSVVRKNLTDIMQHSFPTSIHDEDQTKCPSLGPAPLVVACACASRGHGLGPAPVSSGIPGPKLECGRPLL